MRTCALVGALLATLWNSGQASVGKAAVERIAIEAKHFSRPNIWQWGEYGGAAPGARVGAEEIVNEARMMGTLVNQCSVYYTNQKEWQYGAIGTLSLICGDSLRQSSLFLAGNPQSICRYLEGEGEEGDKDCCYRRYKSASLIKELGSDLEDDEYSSIRGFILFIVIAGGLFYFWPRRKG